MEGPCDCGAYAELLVSDSGGDVHVFVELDVLRELAPEARKLVFVVDLTRRSLLLLDRTAGELLAGQAVGR